MARVLADGTNVRGAPAPRRELTGAATPREDDGVAGWLIDQVRSMTVNDVLGAVRAGTLERADALVAERAGKRRASLLGALEE